MGRCPKREAEKLAKVKKNFAAGTSVQDTAATTDMSMTSVKRYHKLFNDDEKPSQQYSLEGFCSKIRQEVAVAAFAMLLQLLILLLLLLYPAVE